MLNVHKVFYLIYSNKKATEGGDGSGLYVQIKTDKREREKQRE